jgi:hypothetical protein
MLLAAVRMVPSTRVNELQTIILDLTSVVGGTKVKAWVVISNYREVSAIDGQHFVHDTPGNGTRTF